MAIEKFKEIMSDEEAMIHDCMRRKFDLTGWEILLITSLQTHVNSLTSHDKKTLEHIWEKIT